MTMKKYSQREKLIEFQGRNENSNNKKKSETDSRYNTLLKISVFFKSSSWITFGAGVFCLIYFANLNDLFLGLLSVIVGIFTSISFLTTSELIKLFVNLELNTRQKND